MQPTLQIAYRNMDSSPALDLQIRNAVERLERNFGRILSVRVVIDQPHRSQQKGRGFVVSLNVHVPGSDVVVRHTAKADDAAEDAYVAIHMAFDEARRQLNDYVDTHFRPRHDSGRLNGLSEGRVVRIFRDEGYGFIATDGGREVYFDRNSVLNRGFDRLDVAHRVRFAEEAGEEGPQASTVHA